MKKKQTKENKKIQPKSNLQKKHSAQSKKSKTKKSGGCGCGR
jgi:hypothetical protein